MKECKGDELRELVGPGQGAARLRSVSPGVLRTFGTMATTIDAGGYSR